MTAIRLSSHPLALVLAWSLAWGLFSDLFGGDKGPARVEAEAVREAVERVAGIGQHEGTRALYASRDWAPLWNADERRALSARLATVAKDGIDPASIGADDARNELARWEGARTEYARLGAEAREVTPDPRPLAVARADVRLTDALFRLADALAGERLDPAALHPGTWFPARPDSIAHEAARDAIASGDASAALDAVEALQPSHPQALALRHALARLRRADIAPIPDGAPLMLGQHSIRVPHVRARLAAFGYLGEDGPTTGWDDNDPYLFDDALAGALARFRTAHQLDADSILDAATTDALNADLDSLADRVALNVERWRWLPREFTGRHVWVNLPAYHLEVREPDGSVGLEMVVNIGNAQTTGWTTPVLTDSITRVVFRPAWFVPKSLAAAQVFPMAQADSLSLWRQGFEVYQNGAPVDSRLVLWDSVSVGEFRFVQRPGASNPLGRAKFPMTNPYAILIHDTNRSDFGGPVSSGCVHAGDAEALAAYLLRAEGWDEERAQHAYRRGPQRQGVPLADPVLTHFVYLTAEVDDSGALVFHDDPYGYDRRQLAALTGTV
ncbi:MAG: L,D-transpeptidase family protein [Bacteroidota bacterium]